MIDYYIVYFLFCLKVFNNLTSICSIYISEDISVRNVLKMMT